MLQLRGARASLAGWNACSAVTVCPSACSLMPLWLRLFVFLLLFTLSQSPKCLRTTWLSLLLGKQPRWLAVQLIQSSYKGCKDRPADRLNKAWAETAFDIRAQGHAVYCSSCAWDSRKSRQVYLPTSLSLSVNLFVWDLKKPIHLSPSPDSPSNLIGSRCSGWFIVLSEGQHFSTSAA